MIKQATGETFRQYMVDTLILTLNDPAVMGKDTLGYARLKRVLDGWGKCYDRYYSALTNEPETDYYRQMLDDAIRAIVKDSGDFIPFEQRYDWLPKISYEPKKK